MAQWTAFPYDATDYTYAPAALATQWARLHRGDAEPLPDDDAVLAAWSLFHAGRFQQARDAGLQAGGAGITVANAAQSIYANYLETSERSRLALFLEVAERAQAQRDAVPGYANAHYWAAYALGRYGQGTSIAKALQQGLGERVRTALEKAIALAPAHADAHLALGVFHAEVIDTLGKTLGKAQGVEASTGLRLFRQALALNPDSALARVAYANGLVMLEGDKRMQEADQLYAEAAASSAPDATQRLDVERAKAELEEE